MLVVSFLLINIRWRSSKNFDCLISTLSSRSMTVRSGRYSSRIFVSMITDRSVRLHCLRYSFWIMSLCSASHYLSANSIIKFWMNLSSIGVPSSFSTFVWDISFKMAWGPFDCALDITPVLKLKSISSRITAGCNPLNSIRRSTSNKQLFESISFDPSYK